MRLIFDIESDALLEDVTKIHSICAYDLTSKKFYDCCNMMGYKHDIQYGIDLLHDSRQLIGHNIQGFDLPAIEKINGKHFAHWNRSDGLARGVLDTLVLARLCFPDVKDKDNEGAFGYFDKSLFGKHSLEAWGGRLGIKKGDFGKQNGWEFWSKAMQEYCAQDVRVTYKLYMYLVDYIYANIDNKYCVELEHQFSKYIDRQNNNGVPFHLERAQLLEKKVNGSLAQIKKEIEEIVPDQVEEIYFTPKTSNKRYGYVKGKPTLKRIVKKTKASSRPQILAYLKKEYDYVPEEFTDKGNPKLNSDALRAIGKPECNLYADYLDLWKLRGQLISGKSAWLKLTRNGRIFGFCNHNGAVTGRCTHSSPNLSQTPTAKKIFGRECRELFYAPEGYSFVGADASGLELRMLGHYLEPFDDGAFIKEVVHGDIHTKNQKDAGLTTRDNAKTFIYAFNYGAGFAKLGSIHDPSASTKDKERIGRDAKEKFIRSNPAIKTLIGRVQSAAKTRGYIYGLDGRKLHVRYAYRGLNTLLQGAGSVVMKKATVEFADHIERRIGWDKVVPVIHSHDEIQVLVKNGHEDEVGRALVKSITMAGRMLKVRTPLDGVYKVGKTWADTH